MEKEGVIKQQIRMRVHQDRMRILYTNARESMLLYAVWISLMAVMLLFSGANVVGVVSWLILLIIIQLFELRNLRKFFSLRTFEAPDIWEMYKVLVSFAQAFVISTGIMLMIDLEQNIITYIAIVLIVLPAFASAATLATSVKSHYAWLLGLLVPLAVKAAFAEDHAFWVLSGFVFLCAIPGSALVGKQMARSFIDTLSLRFENEALLKTVQKANEDKTRFLAAASHDLRQPLHALGLFTDALEHKLNEPEQFELMDKVKEATTAMDGLLHSLLDISRLDAEVIKVEAKPVLISNLLAKVATSFQPLADSKNIQLELECPPCAVVSDAALLENIFRNILGNALKYTDKGSIYIRCELTDENVSVSIQDSGIGISKENQQLIFSEFYQVHNPERDRTKGLGLGLSIAKRSCELLGHQLHFKSELDKGSTFTLEMKATKVEHVEHVKEASSVVKQLDATVLVIDDEDAILQGMEKMLTPWGCKVLSAANEADALMQLEQHGNRVDLIIADFRLRENALGTDVVAAVYQAIGSNEVPVIIITGDTDPERLKQVQEVGYHILYKPVPAVQMRVLMQNLLRKARRGNAKKV